MERVENGEAWHRGSEGEKRKLVSRNYVAFIIDLLVGHSVDLVRTAKCPLVISYFS